MQQLKATVAQQQKQIAAQQATAAQQQNRIEALTYYAESQPASRAKRTCCANGSERRLRYCLYMTIDSALRPAARIIS